MENALLITSSEKGITFFTEMLHSISCDTIITAKSCGEARRLLLQREFDLCIINAPLSDESGENLSKHIASLETSQVILIVSTEYFDDVSEIVEDYGVITVAKPVNRNLFWSALKLAKASQSRLKRIQSEKSKLNQKIEDIRIIDRAKCILISHLKMNENEAHKYIEKQAMDMRMTRRDVAEGILRTYEN